jgi:hypothetical protein
MLQWIDSKTVGGVSEVTLFTPIKQGLVPGELRTYEQRLCDALQSIQDRIDAGRPTPIGRIPAIHFARWLILRPEHYLHDPKQPCGPTPTQVDGRSPSSWLFFTSNFDGDTKTYLRDFAVFLGDDVDRVWGNCEGYPPGGARDFDEYWAYAKRYQLTTHAFYNAYPGLSVPRIYQLAAFKRLFDDFVAATRGPDGRSIADLPALFDRFIAESAVFPQAFPDLGGVYQIQLPRH